MAVRIQRIYSKGEQPRGTRILVDRYWPRGISRSKARIDEWLKPLAPSDGLRRWFNHRAERWEEFQERYWDELQTPEKKEMLRHLRSLARKKGVTLLYGAKEQRYNNALALSKFVRRPKA